MFCCHSDSRRVMILASLSGCAAIPTVSPDGPGPIRPHCRTSAPSLAGSSSNPQVAPTPSGPMTFHHPAALIFDLDDLTYRLPVAERVVLTAAAEAGTDLDAVGAVEPFDGLQLRRAPCGQSDVGDVFPQCGDIAADSLGHFYRGLIAVAHRCSMPRILDGAAGTTGKRGKR